MATKKRVFCPNALSLRFVLAVPLLLLPACRGSKPPDYQDEAGVHFTPPPGWVERDRPALQPTTNPLAHVEPNLPLPHLDFLHRERVLVRYDRINTADRAWMRLSVVTVPAASRLEDYLAQRMPQADWRRVGGVEEVQVNDQPASRLAWKRSWKKQDYRCEIVAVRRGEAIYLFAASWPAGDTRAVEKVRQAIANAIVP